MNIFYCHEEFIQYLRSEKDISHHTVRNYTADFKQFASFLESNGVQPRLDSITTPMIRRYVSHLKAEKNYKTYTIRRRIHSLSSFFKFLLEQEYIEKNPMLSIHAPKQPHKVPIYLSLDEAKRLLQMPMKHGKEHGLRDKCIIETLLFTGLRRAELLALNWDDIDFGQKTLTVRNGKGNKQRVIPLSEPLISDLWAYLHTRLPLTDRAVFISSNGTRLTCSPMSVTFRRYLRLAGLDGKGYSLHKLRSTFATHLLQHGADLISIQKLLGHNDLNSTKIYAHADMKHLRKEALKFPLSSQ